MKETTHHFWRHCFSCTIIAMPVLLTLLLRTGVAQAASLKSCQPSWKVVGSDDIGLGAYYRNYLTSVSAISTTDAWAVGYYDDGEGLTSGILRWDGSYFHLVSDTPNTSLLYGVAAVSATDVWVVGENYNATTVVEHWDGTQWKLSLAQNAAEPFLNSFRGATAIPNSKEVFAVGTSFYPPDDFANTLVYLYAC